MRHRSIATLGPIVQGLLAVGLCTLVAAAQQPAAPPAPAGAAAATHAPTATAKDAAPVSDAASDQDADETHDASSDDSSTGVANPDPVTPDTSSNAASEGQSAAQPAANATPAPTYIDNSDPIPAAETGDGSVLQEGATGKRFSPDQPSRPITPELDSDKPTPPDPAPSASTPSDATVAPPQQPAAPSTAAQTTPATQGNATTPAPSQATTEHLHRAATCNGSGYECSAADCALNPSGTSGFFGGTAAERSSDTGQCNAPGADTCPVTSADAGAATATACVYARCKCSAAACALDTSGRFFRAAAERSRSTAGEPRQRGRSRHTVRRCATPRMPPHPHLRRRTRHPRRRRHRPLRITLL